MEQSRWRSPVLWGTLVTQIIGLLSAMGFWAWVNVSEDIAIKVTGMCIAIAATFIGVVNDPTNKTGW